MTKIEIYTRSACPYCARAKDLLKEKNLIFTEYHYNGANEELRTEMIQRANGGRTFPQIFIADKHVGGCDDLYALNSSNSLDSLLGISS